MKYTLTHDSITIVTGGKTYNVSRGAPNFNALKQAILVEDWDAVSRRLTVAKSIVDWAKGKFSVVGETISFEGSQLPAGLNNRIVEMVTAGDDPTAIFAFWERLQKNPSMRSVQQLWSFLDHQGIPLTKNGTFLAYKAVRADFKDYHSGKFDNTPGVTNEMPRNQISDDPNHACHEGFHVGALEYANSFGGEDRHVVVCEVDPADVVCVPFDSSSQKMRVSKYKVIGINGGELLSSTTHDEELPDDYDVEELCEFEELDAMGPAQLLDVSTDTLRTYASRGLGIIGASRIPGGKTALVTAITKARRATKRGV